MRHLQRIKDLRRLGHSKHDDGTIFVFDPSYKLYGKYMYNPIDILFGVHVPNFYHWDHTGTAFEKCNRQMIFEQDNAPYNHGVECQIAKYSRDKCAVILRKLDVQSIEIKRAGTTNHNLVVPNEGEKWDIAEFKTTAEEIRFEIAKVIKQVNPSLVEPGFMWLCRKYGILVTYTVPYSSDLCCIEAKWQIGKAWLANPINQKKGRTTAEVVKFLRQQWYETLPDYGESPKEPLDMNIFTKHYHRLMNNDIVELRK